MCNFMSQRVVNLDNRPFYTVVKQIIKKAEAQKQERVDGFVKRQNFHLHKHQQTNQHQCVGKLCENPSGWQERTNVSHPELQEQHIEKICNGTIKSSGTFFFFLSPDTTHPMACSEHSRRPLNCKISLKFVVCACCAL